MTTGEIRVVICGKPYTFILDMRAMCLIEEAMSTPDRDMSMAEIVDRLCKPKPPLRFVHALAWGMLQRHHPEMTPDRVYALMAEPDFRSALDRVVADGLRTAQPDPEDVAKGKGKQRRPR